MKAKVKSPGSCGELVQGIIGDDNFLVTCPINLYSEVEVSVDRSNALKAAFSTKNLPCKTTAVIKKTLEHLHLANCSYQAVLKSELPTGKGMASSSADMSAACLATTLSAGIATPLDQIASILLSIEPTDGIFFPGIVLFNHILGTTKHYLGEPPPLSIVILDTGGSIDTVAFNNRSDLKILNRQKEPLVKQALELVTQGLAAGDPVLIGQGTTLSARANQTILYKSQLETVIDLGAAAGAFGVNIAHSGTIIGVLFPHNASTSQEFAHIIEKRCPDIQYLYTAQLISGGLQKWDGDVNEWLAYF